MKLFWSRICAFVSMWYESEIGGNINPPRDPIGLLILELRNARVLHEMTPIYTLNLNKLN